MSKPKVLLFDFDGVLVDASSKVWSVYLSLRKVYPVKDFKTKEELLSNSQRTVLGTLRSIGIPFWRIPFVLLRIKKAIHSEYVPTAIIGIDAVVKQVAKRHKMAVVSTNMTETVVKVLKEHKIEKYFDKVICGNLSGTKVPLLARALVQFGVKPEECLLITDTVFDVVDARKVGVPVIGVSWGFHSPKRLISAGAKDVANTPKELLRMLHG